MQYVDNELKFKWVLTDYNYHFEKGEMLYSSMFYTQLNGYCFKVIANWTVGKKEDCFPSKTSSRNKCSQRSKTIWSYLL